MKKYLMLVLVAAFLLLASCVPGRGKYEDKKAEFFTGIWHGAISPVTMVIGVFDKKTRIYETDNTGRMYDIGFIAGIFLIWTGSCSQHRRTCRK